MTKASSPFLKEDMQKEKKKKKRRQGVGVPTERSKGREPELAPAPDCMGGGASKLELATPRW